MTENAIALRAAIETCFKAPYDEANLRIFDELFRPRVMAILVALYRKDTAFAEDAYQSSLIKYIEVFRAGKKPEILYESYFVAIAKNSLLDELRKTAKHVSLEEILELPASPDRSRLDETETGIAFFEALSRLDRRCQFLIESFYINGMSQEELAKRLKIQVQSVPVALSRCKEALKNYLKK